MKGPSSLWRMGMPEHDTNSCVADDGAMFTQSLARCGQRQSERASAGPEAALLRRDGCPSRHGPKRCLAPRSLRAIRRGISSSQPYAMTLVVRCEAHNFIRKNEAEPYESGSSHDNVSQLFLIASRCRSRCGAHGQLCSHRNVRRCQ